MTSKVISASKYYDIPDFCQQIGPRVAYQWGCILRNIFSADFVPVNLISGVHSQNLDNTGPSSYVNLPFQDNVFFSAVCRVM